MTRTFPSVGVSPIDVYIEGEVRPAAYFEQVITLPDTDYVRGVQVVGTPTMIAAGNYMGFSVAVAPVGVNGGWCTALYAGITQDSTKRVDGYLCAAELELINSAPNASAMAVLVLDWINSEVPCSQQAFIMLRDYSSGTPCNALFEFGDATESGSDTVLFATQTSAAVSQVIRFTVKGTAYWLMVSNAR